MGDVTMSQHWKSPIVYVAERSSCMCTSQSLFKKNIILQDKDFHILCHFRFVKSFQNSNLYPKMHQIIPITDWRQLVVFMFTL
ncbi:hypothetical protein GDO86_001944 [Hymenochirus boettgeri]|uniref:Uncharacterized protein n=1 Tax=Hymenochirus boettgeri TaxID=247094 RepID=A0A8T2KKR4_9PIPI|nr:hypothetical protein GDO86_001944 [Hymenochirus boettgeri]